MKNRFMIALLFFATVMWTVFGLLFLVRLHYWFVGGTSLALVPPVALRGPARPEAGCRRTVGYFSFSFQKLDKASVDCYMFSRIG